MIIDLFKHCVVASANGCLEWTGTLTDKGRPKAVIAGMRLQQAICTEFHGPRPSPDHDAAHSCHNGICVDGNHLKWEHKDVNRRDFSEDALQRIAEGASKGGEVSRALFKKDLSIPPGIKIRQKGASKGAGRAKINGWVATVQVGGVTKYGGPYTSKSSALKWALAKQAELRGGSTTT